MKKSTKVILIVLVVVLGWLGLSYNSLVTGRESVDNKWAQIDTQLQRRYDLIPNLVSTVKGLTAQEQTVFGQLAEARTQYAGATNPEARATAANNVESSLGRILVIVENYPELRSSAAFQDLMTALEGSENRIGVARKDYNDAVTSLNARIARFPSNVTALIFGIDKRSYFGKSEGAGEVPTVKF